MGRFGGNGDEDEDEEMGGRGGGCEVIQERYKKGGNGKVDAVSHE